MQQTGPVHNPLSNLLCIADGSSVCAVADPALREKIGRMCRVRKVKAGETVIEEGRKRSIVGVVSSGVLKMAKSMADGRQQIVGLLLPFDMFGRVFPSESGSCVQAASDSVLCTFDRPAFEELLRQNPEMEHKMLLSVLDELDAARDWMLLLGCQTVRERVATFLLILARRGSAKLSGNAPHAVRVRVPISRKDMAAYLGTTPESISRALHKFAREGMIKIVDHLTFEIVRREALVNASGREEFDRPEEEHRVHRLKERGLATVK